MNKKSQLMKYIWFFPWILVLIIIFVAIFWSGYFVAQNSSALVDDRVLQLENSLATKESYIVDIQRDLAQAKVGDKLDQQLVLEIQNQLAGLELELSDQKDEISYYREYISPKRVNKNVSVRSFELYASDTFKKKQASIAVDPNKFFYKLVLQSGNVEVDEEVVNVSLSLKVLNSKTDKIETLKLDDGNKQVRFKYFKVIREEINIPLGMEATEVVVRLTFTNGKKLIKNYKWGLTQ